MAAALSAALPLAPVVFDWQPRLIWNASASVPVGLYYAQPVGRLKVGDLIVAMPHKALADFLSKREYLPRGVPLIKHVLALPGANVCRKGATIFVGDRLIAQARERDSLGRSLPHWQGCRTLGEGEIFLMNPDAPDSFDGRYFGPLPVSAISAKLTPVWTDVPARFKQSPNRRPPSRLSGEE
ncbi:S26 family signal peptidase [uncultured Roseibium sp.]|uniref:S26 family signal peptidase n=1 Tax=uncultured Roseibium sp. TaxID=1936171 RepID=UPI003216F0EF